MLNTRHPHSDVGNTGCLIAPASFESIAPLITNTRSPHSFRNACVAWSVGNVCPECETDSTMVPFVMLLVTALKEKPDIAAAPRAFESTPMTLLLEMGTTASVGNSICRSAAKCSAIQSDSATAVISTSTFPERRSPSASRDATRSRSCMSIASAVCKLRLPGVVQSV